MVATASPSAMRVPNEKNQKWSCDGYKKSKKVKARAARSLDNVPLSSTNRGASWVAHNVGSPDVRPRRRDSNGFLLRASFASALVVPRAPPITSAAEMDSTAAMWSPEIASSCPWTLAWAEAARSSCPRVAEVANKPDGGSAPLPTSTGVASLRARMTGDWDRLARGGGRGTPSQRLWGAAFMMATSRRTCMVRDGVEMRLLAIAFTAYRTPVSSCMPSFTLRSLTRARECRTRGKENRQTQHTMDGSEANQKTSEVKPHVRVSSRTSNTSNTSTSPTRRQQPPPRAAATTGHTPPRRCQNLLAKRAFADRLHHHAIQSERAVTQQARGIVGSVENTIRLHGRHD